MSKIIKNLDSSDMKKGSDQTCGFNQFLKCPKTSSPKKLQNIKIGNQRFVQSMVVLADDPKTQTCPSCIRLRQKIEQLKYINLEVGYLKERNEEILEQIQLLSSNFMYILELATENITKGLKSRIQNIVKQKQNIIENQYKIIQRLETQSQVLINKIDNGLLLSEKVEELEQKIRKLQKENRNLKEVKSNRDKSKWDTDSYLMFSTTGEQGQNSPKQFPNQDWNFSSIQMNRQKKQNQQFGIKKRKTLDLEMSTKKDEVQCEQIKSLDNLRLKINQIKSKIINQNF